MLYSPVGESSLDLGRHDDDDDDDDDRPTTHTLPENHCLRLEVEPASPPVTVVGRSGTLLVASVQDRAGCVDGCGHGPAFWTGTRWSTVDVKTTD